MINSVERNLFFVTAAGFSASAVSMASFVFFGLHTYVISQELTTSYICDPDVCQQIKKTALRALPGAIAGTAISAFALYASITLTRQLKSHIITMGAAPATANKLT